MEDVKSTQSIYPIREAAVLACNDIEQRAQQKRDGSFLGVRVGIPMVDSDVNPMQAGDLVSVIGRPQNYKSGFMEYVFDNTVLHAMNTSTNRCAIHVTWEVSVEVHAMHLMSRYTGASMRDMLRGNISEKTMGELKLAALTISGMPVFIIGNTTSRGKDGRRGRQLLTRQLVEDGIDHIINGNEFVDIETNQNFDPAIITFDYLQLIPQLGQNRREWLMSSMKWAKDMAFFAGCPAVMGVQARRDVDDRNIKIPMIRDGEETSAIEQYSDVVFSCCIPHTYIQLQGDEVDWLKAHGPLKVTPDLFFLSLLKQKNNAAGKAWALSINYQTNKIVSLSERGR